MEAELADYICDEIRAEGTPDLSKAGWEMVVAALRRPAPTESDIRAAQSLEAEAALYSGDKVVYSGNNVANILATQATRVRLAALSPAGDTGREAVPVAWRYRFSNEPWRYVEDKPALYNTSQREPLYASPLPAARIGREGDPIWEALRHAEVRFQCLAEDFNAAGDTVSWAMCSVDAERMGKALSLTASASAGGWQDIIDLMVGALEEAKKLADLTEKLCACGSDDDYVWGVQKVIEDALAAAAVAAPRD